MFRPYGHWGFLGHMRLQPNVLWVTEVYLLEISHFVPLFFATVSSEGFWVCLTIFSVLCPIIFHINHKSIEMRYYMALMPMEMKLGSIHLVTLQGQLCHVLQWMKDIVVKLVKGQLYLKDVHRGIWGHIGFDPNVCWVICYDLCLAIIFHSVILVHMNWHGGHHLLYAFKNVWWMVSHVCTLD